MGKIDAFFNVKIHPKHKKLVERNFLTVQGSSLWFSHSSQSFFKNYARSNETITREGYTIPHMVELIPLKTK